MVVKRREAVLLRLISEGHDADGPVDLLDDQPTILHVFKAVLADRGLQLGGADAFARELILKDPSVPHEKRRLSFEEGAEPLVPENESRQKPVDPDQSQSGDDPTQEGSIRSHHCVLDCVGDQEHQHEIDDGELPHVPLTGEPQRDENREVDDQGADDRVREDGPRRSAEVEHFLHHRAAPPRAPATPPIVLDHDSGSRISNQDGDRAGVRALVLEDDLRLRSLVVRTLSRAGLACDEASRVDEAEELLSLHNYDLLVLDRRLPDGDGLDVCRRARRKGFGHSVLMLTARDDPESTVEGLSEGADDYLGKPFDLEVLQARARALLRRNEQRSPEELTSGTLRLDSGRRLAWCAGRTLDLTAREFTILEALMRRPGAVVSREEILEQAWGEREEPMSNTIDVLIGRLRKKIDGPGRASRIETMRGMGYRLR